MLNKLHQKSKRLGVAALSLLLLASSVFPGVSANAEETKNGGFSDTELQLINAIDTDFMLEHIEYVHNNIGPRYAGTPADEASADYFAGVFEDLGYEPFTLATSLDGTEDYFEEFEFSGGERIGGSITIDGRAYTATGPVWDDSSVYFGYNTPSVTGETVYFETVEEAVAADASAVSGKIVLTNRKDLTEDGWDRNGTAYADVARALEEKGVGAVVFFYSKYTVSEEGATSRERQFPAPTSGEEIQIPVILVPYLDGRTIVSSLTHHDEVASTTATVVNRVSTGSSNVLAIKEAAVPSDKYVMVGAHRDSVLNAEGVNDNLSGTVNVLAIAKAFREISTDYNIIFALWGAEEGGLQGSKAFYKEVIAPENWGVEHIVAYYNMDMAATSQTRNSVLTIHTAYRDADKNPLQTLAGDVAEAQAERYWDYADGAFGTWWTQGPDDLVDLQYFGSCSDHASISGANAGVAFGEGIPAVYVFWGDRIGDGRNDVTEQNYHVVGDIYEWPEEEDDFTVISDSETFTGNYSVERAQILATVFALSTYNTAIEGITEIEDGATYYGDTSFTVSYNYREGVILDGEAVTVEEDGILTIPADNGEHTVTLTDVFGNTQTYTVSVSKTYTVTFVADGTVVAERTVRHGASVTDIPTIPSKEGYTQTAPVWDTTDLSEITADVTVTAVYTKDAETTPDTDTDEDSEIPQTGDAVTVFLWASLVLSGAGILAVAISKKYLTGSKIR